MGSTRFVSTPQHQVLAPQCSLKKKVQCPCNPKLLCPNYSIIHFWHEIPIFPCNLYWLIQFHWMYIFFPQHKDIWIISRMNPRRLHNITYLSVQLILMSRPVLPGRTHNWKWQTKGSSALRRRLYINKWEFGARQIDFNNTDGRLEKAQALVKDRSVTCLWTIIHKQSQLKA